MAAAPCVHPSPDFWRGRRVLVTGHTGFKGSWLCVWLREMGAQVVGTALDPEGEDSLFSGLGLHHKLQGDYRDELYAPGQEGCRAIREAQPEVVFHLAAQPLVRLSYEQPELTYATNVMGTIRVLEALRELPGKRVGVFITTDKCYENRERLWGYREDEPMGGYDPYSSSKGCCELAISSWRRSFMNPADYPRHEKSVASARAGNVIGGGDWARDRIVPDCIRAFQAGLTVDIRSPHSVRPWQHVLEPLAGYLTLAERLWNEPTDYCEGWNFGPRPEGQATVWDVATLLAQAYGAAPEALRDASGGEQPHEAAMLTLDITKARARLGWQPRLTLRESVQWTAEWYRRAAQGDDQYRLCAEQIARYQNLNCEQ